MPPPELSLRHTNAAPVTSTSSQTVVAVDAPLEAQNAPRQASFPLYDGSSDYTFYRAQFLALAAKHPVSEWTHCLVAALREPASHILATLTAAQLNDFYEVDAALQTRFCKPRHRNQVVQTLKMARQQSGQTLREFGLHVNQLCQEAYRDDPVVSRNLGVLKKLVLDNFIAGIADPATRRLLLMSRPADLTSALATVSELEDAPHVCQRVRQVDVEAAAEPTLVNNAVAAPDPDLVAVLSELTAAINTCWRCQNVGHTGRICDQRPEA